AYSARQDRPGHPRPGRCLPPETDDDDGGRHGRRGRRARHGGVVHAVADPRFAPGDLAAGECQPFDNFRTIATTATRAVTFPSGIINSWLNNELRPGKN